MRESCTYGSARGAFSNGRPYRNRRAFMTLSAARPHGRWQRARRTAGFIASVS